MIMRTVSDCVAALASENRPPVLLVSESIRWPLGQLLTASLPRLVVMSYGEVPRDVAVESVAMASIDATNAWQSAA